MEGSCFLFLAAIFISVDLIHSQSVSSRTNVNGCNGRLSCPHSYSYSNNCIWPWQLCDGTVQCPNDRWDEKDCENGRECRIRECQHSCVYEQGFPRCYCSEGYTLQSNGIKCDDINECETGSHQCNQTCTNIDGSYECSCQVGFELGQNERDCIDIDECESENDCEHICVNNIGSYKCTCQPGYQTANDGKHCKTKGPSPELMFTTSNEIFGLNINNKWQYSIKKTRRSTLSVAYESSSKSVYWLEIFLEGGVVVKSKVRKDEIEYVDIEQLKCPTDMALDTLNSKLYLIEPCIHEIIACDTTKHFCASVVSGIDGKPSSIVVDPTTGYMYWTQWMKEVGIYKSGMDGSAVTALHSYDDQTIRLTGIALDLTTSVLYWAEYELGKIKSMTTEGKKLRTTYTQPAAASQPYSLAVFEDQLYFSDKKMEGIFTFKKKEERTSPMTDDNKIARGNVMDVHMFHPLLIPTGDNPCANGTCTDMCLLAPNKSFTCFCPSGVGHFTECIVTTTTTESPNVRFPLEDTSNDSVADLGNSSLGLDFDDLELLRKDNSTDFNGEPPSETDARVVNAEISFVPETNSDKQRPQKARSGIELQQRDHINSLISRRLKIDHEQCDALIKISDKVQDLLEMVEQLKANQKDSFAKVEEKLDGLQTNVFENRKNMLKIEDITEAPRETQMVEQK